MCLVCGYWTVKICDITLPNASGTCSLFSRFFALHSNTHNTTWYSTFNNQGFSEMMITWSPCKQPCFVYSCRLVAEEADCCDSRKYHHAVQAPMIWCLHVVEMGKRCNLNLKLPNMDSYLCTMTGLSACDVRMWL